MDLFIIVIKYVPIYTQQASKCCLHNQKINVRAAPQELRIEKRSFKSSDDFVFLTESSLVEKLKKIHKDISGFPDLNHRAPCLAIYFYKSAILGPLCFQAGQQLIQQPGPAPPYSIHKDSAPK